MSGVDASNGQPLAGFDHVLQSIEKIVTTPVGSRVMRPWFGNPGLRLLGETMTEENILRWVSTIWALVELFEPRFKITRFELKSLNRTGAADFYFDGVYQPYGHLGFQQVQGSILYSNGSILIRER